MLEPQTALEYAKNLRLTGQELSGSEGTAGGLRRAPEAVEDVKVIVCGLNYTDKTRYRAAVQVEYSTPITLDSSTVERFMTVGEEKAAVKLLIKAIEARLRSVTVNADDWESLWTAQILRQFIWPLDGLGPLHHYRHNMQQLSVPPSNISYISIPSPYLFPFLISQQQIGQHHVNKRRFTIDDQEFPDRSDRISPSTDGSRYHSSGVCAGLPNP
jgi:hypothetical protein